MCTGSSGEFQSAEENLRIQADKLGMAPWAECLPCRHKDPHKSQQGGCGPNPNAAGQRQEGSVRDPVPRNTNKLKKKKNPRWVCYRKTLKVHFLLLQHTCTCLLTCTHTETYTCMHYTFIHPNFLWVGFVKFLFTIEEKTGMLPSATLER